MLRFKYVSFLIMVLLLNTGVLNKNNFFAAEISSVFGIGYAQPGLAGYYSEIGIKFTKVFAVPWGIIEPLPPKNGRHTYEWKRLDDLVKEYQSAGFDLQLTITSNSRWATKPLPDGKRPKTFIVTNAPKDEHWGDYAEFIQNIVERYDGDGKDDMPGLRSPVKYYEIETEAQHGILWRGTKEEYIRLLKTAYISAKKADPNTRIILSGFNFGDVFDDDPTEDQLDSRINKTEYTRRVMSFIKETLKASDFFDIVEFHNNRDYLGIIPTIKWIKGIMKKNGYDKPIWAGDATSAPWIVPTPFDVNPIRLMKDPEEIYNDLLDKSTKGHKEAVSWYRAEQSKLTIKKFITAIGAGLDRLIIETFTDAEHITENQPGLKGFRFQGMMDENRNPYPVYYAIRLLIKKIGETTSFKKLDLGNDIFGYSFSRNDLQIFILWSRGQAKSVQIRSNKEDLLITYPITEIDQTEPRTRNIKTKGGVVDLEVTDTPIFVEEIR